MILYGHCPECDAEQGTACQNERGVPMLSVHKDRLRMFLHTFIVSGKGWFPSDMLRYDQCHTYDPRILNDPDHYYDKPIEVTMFAWSTNYFWQPTKARWSSFLWGCSDARRIEA
jgi:hypothetical protein